MAIRKMEIKRAVPGRLLANGRFVPNPKRSGIEEVLYRKFRKEGYSRSESKRFAKLNAPYFGGESKKNPQVPHGKWTSAKVRFRKGGTVDVIVPRSREHRARTGNPSSYIVYPANGSPKSFGFLKSAKKWAKEQANQSGISSVIYPQGKGKTHHVSPDRKAKR